MRLCPIPVNGKHKSCIAWPTAFLPCWCVCARFDAQKKGGGIVVLPIIGNPLSTTLTEEEEAGFIEVLRHNPTLAFVADHAYRGYNKHGATTDPGGLQVRSDSAVG